MRDDTEDAGEPKRDFAKMFDLDRTTAIKNYVDSMERCLRDAQTARDELKEVCADAKEKEFSPRDVEAMKKIAKLRLEDKKGAAQEQLEALERIGKAVGFDLFNWAATRGPA